MANFKMGARARVIDEDHHGPLNDSIGVILDDSAVPFVAFKGWGGNATGPHGFGDHQAEDIWCHSSDQLELVTETGKFVVIDEVDGECFFGGWDGTVYDSKDQAVTEAKECAEELGGKYLVFQAITSVGTTRTPVIKELA